MNNRTFLFRKALPTFFPTPLHLLLPPIQRLNPPLHLPLILFHLSHLPLNIQTLSFFFFFFFTNLSSQDDIILTLFFLFLVIVSLCLLQSLHEPVWYIWGEYQFQSVCLFICVSSLFFLPHIRSSL